MITKTNNTSISNTERKITIPESSPENLKKIAQTPRIHRFIRHALSPLPYFKILGETLNVYNQLQSKT